MFSVLLHPNDKVIKNKIIRIIIAIYDIISIYIFIYFLYIFSAGVIDLRIKTINKYLEENKIEFYYD